MQEHDGVARIAVLRVVKPRPSRDGDVSTFHFLLSTFYFSLSTFYSTETTGVSHRNDATAQRLYAVQYRTRTDTADLKVGTTYVQL